VKKIQHVMEDSSRTIQEVGSVSWRFVTDGQVKMKRKRREKLTSWFGMRANNNLPTLAFFQSSKESMSYPLRDFQDMSFS